MKRVIAGGLSALILSASVVGVAAASSPGRLQGKFKVTLKVTSVSHVYGVKVGDTKMKTWSFKPACASGACATVLKTHGFAGNAASIRLTPTGRGYRATIVGPLACELNGKVISLKAYKARLTLRLSPTTTMSGDVKKFDGTAQLTGAPTAAGKAFHCPSVKERVAFHTV